MSQIQLSASALASIQQYVTDLNEVLDAEDCKVEEVVINQRFDAGEPYHSVSFWRYDRDEDRQVGLGDTLIVHPNGVTN